MRVILQLLRMQDFPFKMSIRLKDHFYFGNKTIKNTLFSYKLINSLSQATREEKEDKVYIQCSLDN